MGKQLRIKDIYELTPMQEGMLFHYLEDDKSLTYVEQMSFTIEGDLDVLSFEKSFNILVERHDVLRTIFNYKNAKHPVQIVLAKRSGKITYKDISTYTCQRKVIKDMKNIELKKGFDLSKDMLMRIIIIKKAKNTYEIIWTHHHIIIDGWCLGIMMKEFFTIYDAVLNNKPIYNKEEVPYKQYIKWIKQQDKNIAKSYWTNYLSNYTDYANLPQRHNNCNKTTNYELKEYIHELSQELTAKLNYLVAEQKITLNILLQCVWGIILQRYNNIDDIVFGSIVSGRTTELDNIEDMMGLFINTIPVRITCNDKQTFLELLKNTQHNALDRVNYEYLPLTEIQEYHQNNHKLVDHIMIFENYPLEDIEEFMDKRLSLIIKDIDIFSQTNYDLNIIIMPSHKITFKFNYNNNSYEEDFINRIAQQFERVIQTILINPNIYVDDINILTHEEIGVLKNFNNTDYGYEGRTINQLFEEQVERTPEHIAIVSYNKKITYRELNNRSNQLAHTLLGYGVSKGSIVGLMVRRNVEMLIGILSILKTGAAYLPIDPELPVERINYMLNDSGTHTIVSDDFINNNYSQNIVNILDETIYEQDSHNIHIDYSANNLAYVIYTSGSTGNPKGVMIQHKSFHNFILGITHDIPFDMYKTLLCITTISFDIFGLETLLAVIKGLKVVLASEIEQKDFKLLSHLIVKEKVNMIQITPSRLQGLLNHPQHCTCLENLSHIMVGGESFPQNLYNGLRQFTKAKIYNMYGPTETTVWSTYKEIIDNNVDIGKPISNTKIHILDNHYRIMPIGAIGELYISGDGLAQGYINNKKLTNDKFIKDVLDIGERIYKTGDLGRWKTDGNIEYCGRVDNQIKIRGFRIELGEIENKIRHFEKIKDVILIVKKDSFNMQYICAYYTTDTYISIKEIRVFMEKELPMYMVPSYFIRINNIPLTTNGKINTKALPEPDQININEDIYEKPSNEIETELLEIWGDILERDKIGVMDNFFEIGGHSLKATLLMGRIYNTFKIELSIKEIFNNPTIRSMANIIMKGTISNQPIETIENRSYYPLSSAQKRMYLLNQLEENSVSYNMPQALLIKGELNKQKLKKALVEIVKKHESLRTSFHVIDGELVQVINENIVLDIEDMKNDGKHNFEILYSNFIRPFSLEKAPLLRVALTKINKNTYYLFVDMHHIISDGTSIDILIKDFAMAYKGETLEPLKIQYKDYAVWQNKKLKSDKLLKQEEYWLHKLGNDLPVLNIPTDYSRPVLQSYEGNNIQFTISQSLKKEIDCLKKETGTTTYMVLLAAFKILLHKYSSQEDIVVGTVVAGRNHIDLQGIIGMFINTLIIRSQPTGNKTFKEYLDEIKILSIHALENQDYPFEDLLKKLDVKRDMSRNAVFDAMFVLHNQRNDDLFLEDINIKPCLVKSKVARTDIQLNVNEKNGQIMCNLEYSSKLFQEDTINRMIQHYINILKEIVKHTDKKLMDINILLEDEWQQLVNGFNNTQSVYSSEKAWYQLFEEQVDRTPNNRAIVCGDKTMSYRQLNMKSNQLARVFKHKGVSNQVIGIMVEPSIEMIIGILGILKSGNAFLPIDAYYPTKRIDYMLLNSKANILLTNFKISKALDQNIRIYNLMDNKLYQGIDTNLNMINNRNNLMYAIYTSGTTGVPKGVAIKNHNITNYIEWLVNKFNINDCDKTALVSSYCFDLGYTSLFSPLIRGAELHLVHRNLYIEPNELLEYIYFNKLTYLKCTPSLFNMMINTPKFIQKDYCKSLRLIILGGEPIKVDDIQLYHNIYPNTKIINHYGPSECTIGSVTYEIDLNNIEKYKISPVIGKPIANTSIYILGTSEELKPIGVVGELGISGEGVARGYLNNHLLTQRKFINNPYRPNEKIYLTGDLAKLLPDGNILFLGRADQQVKIRGYRVELGEVEHHINSIESIEDVVVLNKTNEKGIRLCAYYVAEQQVKPIDIRNKLVDKIPEYMIPTEYICIQQIPLTSSGKVNKKVLLDWDLKASRLIEYVEPRNKIEELLTKIWTKALGINRISINDNYFTIGGDSIMAVKIVLELNKHDIELKVIDIFKRPTIEELAQYIKNKADTFSSINTITELEQAINRDFNIQVKIIKRVEEYGTIYIMYVEESFECSNQELMNYMQEYVNPDILPHSIQRVHRDIIINMDNIMDDFIYDKVDKIYNDLEEQIDNQEKEYAKHIMENKVNITYKLSPTQELLYHSPAIYSGINIRIDEYLDIDILEKSMLKLIQAHGSFRSGIKLFKDELMIVEYCHPNNLTIPFIDISNYEYKIREEIIRKLVIRFYYKEYKINGLLHRLLIIKENLRNYKLLIPFHHAIYDGMSGQVIEDQLLNLYKAIKNGNSYDINNKNTKYIDYIGQITKGPIHINENNIIKQFQLEKFHYAIKKMQTNLKVYNESSQKDYVFTLSMGSVTLRRHMGNMWEIALGLLVAIFKTTFDCKQIPIIMFNYGRHYEDNNYFDSVGNFIDFIPITIDTDFDKREGLKNVIEQKIKTSATHNINFAALLLDENLKNKYSTVYKLLEPAKNTLIMFNYYGLVTEDNLKTRNEVLAGYKQYNENKYINHAKILFEFRYTKEQMLASIHCPSNFFDSQLVFEEILGNQLNTIISQLDRN